jgi:hypothetical protein
MHEEKPGEAAAILAMELRSREGSIDLAQDTQDAKRLRQYLRPDTDALLPHLSPAGGQPPPVTVAYTQPKERRHWQPAFNPVCKGSEPIQSASLSVAFSYSFSLRCRKR